MPWLRWISLCDLVAKIALDRPSWLDHCNLGKGKRASCFESFAKNGGEAGFVQPFFRNGNHGVVELGIVKIVHIDAV
jgi:hypothetical protein